MADPKEPLEPGSIYHIFNRANGHECLFLNDNNYEYFLRQYRKYVMPVARGICYCLMPNHFHFTVQIRDEDLVEQVIATKAIKSGSASRQKIEELRGVERQDALSLFIARQFSHLFNSYTQAFNKQTGRRGSLFMHGFKRKKVTDETYLAKLIHYIHYNPVEAGLVHLPWEWKPSSYANIVSGRDGLVESQLAIRLFEDVENFMFCHRHPPKITGVE